jgi:hypothetical protein
MKRNSSSKVIRIFTSTLLLAVGTSLYTNNSTKLMATDCTPPPSGLISWWPGESSTADVIGTNCGTLSLSGAIYTAGQVGQAFCFDGTNGYMSIPDAPALKPTTSPSKPGSGSILPCRRIEAVNKSSSKKTPGPRGMRVIAC